MPPPPARAAEALDARAILESYARSWHGAAEMPLSARVVIAFRVNGEGGGQYHTTLSSAPGATVSDGAPADFDLEFELTMDELRRLHRGEMSALTMMGQARAGDPVPLRFRLGRRLEADPDGEMTFRRLLGRVPWEWGLPGRSIPTGR